MHVSVNLRWHLKTFADLNRHAQIQKISSVGHIAQRAVQTSLKKEPVTKDKNFLLTTELMAFNQLFVYLLVLCIFVGSLG